jgi:BolA protein
MSDKQAAGGPVTQAIETKLRQALHPTRLKIIDESGLHAGHAGARAGGESHFRVEIEAASFAGLSRVERQRRVHAVLAAELAGPVHALSLSLTAPGERAAKA